MGSNTVSDIEKKIANEPNWLGRNYPFLALFVQYIIMGVLHFGYWAIMGLLMTGAFSFIVGVSESVASIQGFIGGMQWAVSASVGHADHLFLVFTAIYPLYLLQYREVLNKKPTYVGEGRRKWKGLAFWTVVSGVLALFAGVSSVMGGVPSVVQGLVPVQIPVAAGFVAYWLAAHRMSRWLTWTLFEDKWLSDFHVAMTIWRWPARMSLAYGVFVALAGPLMWLSPSVSLVAMLLVPAVGVVYLVRRVVGDAIAGRSMTPEEQEEALRAEGVAEIQASLDDDSTGKSSSDDVEVTETNDDSEWKFE